MITFEFIEHPKTERVDTRELTIAQRVEVELFCAKLGAEAMRINDERHIAELIARYPDSDPTAIRMLYGNIREFMATH